MKEAIFLQTPQNDSVTAPQGGHALLDTVGAGVSFACALHCLAMPFVVGILPLMGLGFLADHTTEAIFIVLSICLAMLSLCWGLKTHKNYKAFIVFLFSAFLIGSGIFLVSETFHLMFIVMGAIGIATSHLLNIKLCRSCTSCSKHP